MRALVINLADAAERMAFQTRQLAALGIDHDRLEAIDRRTVAPPPEDPYWTGWERPLRITEMAALCSHRAAWQAIARGDDPVLVLEDDAILMPGTPAFLRTVAPLTGIDHITLETRGRRKLVARRPHPAAPMRRLYQDRTGAAAYVLWPAGAASLLRRTDRRPALADAAICAARDLSSWQADPALAIQADRCTAHGLTAPFDPGSRIDRVARPARSGLPLGRRLAYAGRRLAAQLTMAARALRYRPLGRLRDVECDIDPAAR